jgi:hypothetical protein
MKIKTISIRQPWADLIIFGYMAIFKTVETRTWATNYRGILAIHASKTIDHAAFQYFQFSRAMPLKLRSLGAIIGIVNLTEIIDYGRRIDLFASDYRKHHVPHNGFKIGMKGWVLSDPKPLDKPIPCRGMPGLFDVEIPDRAMPGAVK